MTLELNLKKTLIVLTIYMISIIIAFTVGKNIKIKSLNESQIKLEQDLKDMQSKINDIQNQMERNEINDDELQNENYDLDVDNLAEADSDNENKNVHEQQENNVENQNNNMESNNQNRSSHTFNKIMTQKITDIIDNVKTFPEGNLELQPSQKAFRSQVPK